MAEEWWLELEAKSLHGSEVAGRDNELEMPGVFELSEPSIYDTTLPRPYLLSKPPQQSHLQETKNSNAVGYRGCLIQTASGQGSRHWKIWEAGNCGADGPHLPVPTKPESEQIQLQQPFPLTDATKTIRLVRTHQARQTAGRELNLQAR